MVIEKIKNKENIDDNITFITLIEFPPIIHYNNFRGKIYFIDEEDQILAAILQLELRKIVYL